MNISTSTMTELASKETPDKLASGYPVLAAGKSALQESSTDSSVAIGIELNFVSCRPARVSGFIW